ncbi:MAG: nucleotidyltransferase family protein [Thermodesulfobacteriota bacterium]|nr:nucleotidyltransferase family protein [Thermodesulfobacteriota bacterium]
MKIDYKKSLTVLDHLDQVMEVPKKKCSRAKRYSNHVAPGQASIFNRQSKSFSPEEYLLVLAARIEMDSADAAGMEGVLKEGLDWPAVKASAHRLGVGPLLYKHLSQEKYAHYVPDDMINFLKGSYRKQAIRNLRIYGQISRMLNSMNQADIPIILLKGAFLAKWVYGDIALRPMSDIDILCKREDAETVKKRLIELGYYQDETIHYDSPLHEKIAAERSKHMPPFSKNRATRIEVHINILGKKTQGVSEEMTRLWETAIPADMNGLRVYSLSPEYQALYLSVHLFRHRKAGNSVLYWFCDIHEVVRKYRDRIDWKDFWDRAGYLGYEAQICSIFKLIKGRWNCSLPKFNSYCPGAEAEIDKPGLEAILGVQSEARRVNNILPSYMENLKIAKDIEGWSGCLYYLWRVIFPTRANLMCRYHPGNSFLLSLYHIIHPFKLGKRASLSLFYNLYFFFREEKKNI